LTNKRKLLICHLQDAGITADNVRIVKETVEKMGGLDIIVANAGWTRLAKRGDIYDLTLDEWNKVSGKESFLWIPADHTVLGNKCPISCNAHARSSANIQFKRRWRGVSNYFLDCSTYSMLRDTLLYTFSLFLITGSFDVWK